MKRKKICLFIFIFLLLVGTALAASHLPEGLLKIQEENARLAKDFLSNISFFIAFLAGITTILSPCILPFLPAFFSITFKEKRDITKMTGIFFMGFTLVFVSVGLLAVVAGKTFVSLIPDTRILIPLAGGTLVGLGILAFFGKGFSGFISQKKRSHDNLGIFGYGILFAIGWSACTGPILMGILLMASFFGNFFTATYLMIAYSLGVFMPLLLLSVYFDRSNLSKSKWLRGKSFKLKILNKRVDLHTNSMIAGSLFVITGLIFIFFEGTKSINGFNMFGLRTYFYNWQNLFMENPLLANVIGIGLLSIVTFILFKHIKRGKGNKNDLSKM